MDSCYKCRLHILCHEVCLPGGADHGNAFIGCWSGISPIRTCHLEAIRMDTGGDNSPCSGIDGLQVSIADQLAWWMLRREICYLHDRFRESNQQGDFMTDMEGVYESLDEYLTGGQYPVRALAALEEPYVEPQISMVIKLIVQFESLSWTKTSTWMKKLKKIAGDAIWSQIRGNLRSSEWATIHFGDRDEHDHDRMLAFSQANQLRLQNALASLQNRRAQAEEQGDWEAAATFTRAMSNESSQELPAFSTETFRVEISRVDFGTDFEN